MQIGLIGQPTEFQIPSLFPSLFPSPLSPELKDQLLARSSRVDDIGRLKAEFNEQRREINEQNEVELENLKRYTRTHTPMQLNVIYTHLYR